LSRLQSYQAFQNIASAGVISTRKNADI
jgi:hypothetical protein